eukprot:Sspe_Gene.66849::Locus_39497_Transcript_6_6_Confidence_0.545_Length_923::g.66849::m.66849
MAGVLYHLPLVERVPLGIDTVEVGSRVYVVRITWGPPGLPSAAAQCRLPTGLLTTVSGRQIQSHSDLAGAIDEAKRGGAGFLAVVLIPDEAADDNEEDEPQSIKDYLLDQVNRVTSALDETRRIRSSPTTTTDLTLDHYKPSEAGGYRLHTHPFRKGVTQRATVASTLMHNIVSSYGLAHRTGILMEAEPSVGHEKILSGVQQFHGVTQ